MTVRGEKGIDRLWRTPPASGQLHKAAPIDSGRVMMMASNMAHLCEQNLRHLVTDLAFNLDELASKDLTGYSEDVTRDATMSVASAAHVWDQINFSRRTGRRYGPFVLVPDEGDRAVSAVPRKVRVVVQSNVGAGAVQAGVCAVMTRGSSPDDIHTGRYLDAREDSMLASGVVSTTFDLEPSAVVDGSYRYDRSLPSAQSADGATQTQVRVFYLWMGFSVWRIIPGTLEVLSVSAYEIR